MSYNIDSIAIVYRSDDFGFPPGTVADIARSEYCPECWADDDAQLARNIREGFFPWTGEGSGRAEDLLVELLGRATGHADLVLTWEGGDSFTGLRVRGGTVTRHEVVMTLGKEEK